jgi:Mitochondrial carrier protein
LYKGVVSNVLKEAPNAAIYLGCYELFKRALLTVPFFAATPLLAFCLAGMAGDAVGSVVRVPAEIVNKKLQLGLARDWRAAVRASFLTPSGLEGTLASWKAVALRDVPYGGIQIALYEALRPALRAALGAAGTPVDVAAGAAAGLVAAVVTTPADVLVTRMSAQNPQCYLETRAFMSPLATARRMAREPDGLRALWAGAAERGLYYAPLIGVFFAAYEAAKFAILHPRVAVAVLASGVGGAVTFAAAAVMVLVRRRAPRRAVGQALRIVVLAAARVKLLARGRRARDETELSS